MKTVIALVVLCVAVSAPSFAAEHLVTHSAKVVGKGSYRAAKDAGKAGKAVVKFVV